MIARLIGSFAYLTLNLIAHVAKVLGYGFLRLCLVLLLLSSGALAQVVLSPAPGATRALCATSGGTVVFDGGLLGTCSTTGRAHWHCGRHRHRHDDNRWYGVSLWSTATLSAGGKATVAGT